MTSPFIIADNFLPNPELLIADLRTREFEDLTGPDGAVYKRVSPLDPSYCSDLIGDAVKRPVDVTYLLARLNLAGEPPNNAIHSDEGYDEFAMVLYLTAPEHCKGGTAFWKHRNYGFTSLPTQHECRQVGRSPSTVLNTLKRDFDRPDAWLQTHLAEMKFNRAIFYPTKRFHSRSPFEAFGSDITDGRLIVVSFFSSAR